MAPPHVVMRNRSSPAATYAPEGVLRGFFSVFRYSRRAVDLVWTTSRPLTVSLAALTLLAGILPAAVAWIGAPPRT
jgi:ATP-binding cassette, subfamily B, bacterial